jgi:radical SAM protein with 4Fe4S-binding SPASM domain
MKRKGGQMTDELFHKIIKEGKEIKDSYFVPFLNGEPFVFPKIWEWLDYMRDVKVLLVTNAEYMDVDRLIKYPNIISVYCSVNATTKETHKKVMRGPDFDKVIKNVESLIAKSKFRIRVSMVVVEANQHEVKDFKKRWGRRAKTCRFVNWMGDVHDPLELQGERFPCKALMDGITVLWDGRVVPCCLDYEGKLIIGDANKQTLSEIWGQSSWMRECHNKLQFDMDPCRNCNHNTKCQT